MELKVRTMSMLGDEGAGRHSGGLTAVVHCQSLGLDLSGYGGMICLVLRGGFLLLALGGRGLGFTWVSVR
ncbi:hypothetical protein MRB53_023744 [Persea americana]|uniref:Uncharacterized protein n=1 Tax=Persea americana TaxID=3435 RepID=A0ACC2LAH4_PERAE|nr:hypothetical protein MRB53_023744 [Persea americana]